MTGKFATSRAGQDKGRLYVVLGEEEKYAYLSDGRLRTVDKPKRKLKKHIQIIHRKVDQELLGKLEKKEKVLDEEIKYAIKQYNNLKTEGMYVKK